MLLNFDVGEDSDSPLDSKEIKPVNPKDNQYSLEELILKLKFQYLANWCKEQLIGKGPDAGKDWGQKEKGVTEDEMIR